jgi:hypothetical protein
VVQCIVFQFVKFVEQVAAFVFQLLAVLPVLPSFTS